MEFLLTDFMIFPQFKVDDLEAQLQTKDKIIQQLTEGLKDKERQMQQCMEIFRPTPQVRGGGDPRIGMKHFIEWPCYFVVFLASRL